MAIFNSYVSHYQRVSTMTLGRNYFLTDLFAAQRLVD